MEFGRKLLLIGTGLLALAGIGEYSLYKKFENSPHPLTEMMRWPWNRECAQLDELDKELSRLTKEREINGRISLVKKDTEIRWKHGYLLNGFHGVLAKTSTRELIPVSTFQLESRQEKYLCYGPFFAKIGYKVKIRVMPQNSPEEIHCFIERVEEFRRGNPTFCGGLKLKIYEDVIEQLEPTNTIRSYEVLKMTENK